jgi:hypothetical protein
MYLGLSNTHFDQNCSQSGFLVVGVKQYLHGTNIFHKVNIQYLRSRMPAFLPYWNLLQNKALAYILKFCKYKLNLPLLQTFIVSRDIEGKKNGYFWIIPGGSKNAFRCLIPTHHHLPFLFSSFIIHALS